MTGSKATLHRLAGTPLRRYRTMSFVAGVALIVLWFVAVPLTSAHHPTLGRYLGVGHGVVIFPLYAASAIQLIYTMRLRWQWWILMLAGGLLPLVAFVSEHFVTHEVRRTLRSATTPSR